MLCPFQAQCARAFRARARVRARAGGSGGADGSLITIHARCTMCSCSCPRNRTSVGLQAAVRKQGAAGASEGRAVEESLPKSLCLEALLTVAPWGGTGLCLKCTLSPAAESDVVPDLIQWYGGTSPARSVLYQAFKPVALPERPFSHTRTRRLPLGGTRGTVAEGPSLYIWARVRSSGRARTRETTIPSAETGTSSRLALPTGNKVAKAIGFLPEERGKSAPPPDLACPI